MSSSERIAVVGLGYVGLPVAIALSRHYPNTIGFDTSTSRVDALKDGVDSNGEVSEASLRDSGLRVTGDPAHLKGASFFVVAVPTPIDARNHPDLRPLIRASELVGSALQPGGLVVFESTVYPGVTEEICGPVLGQTSGLRQHHDFRLGYSPERINPGDREHTLERIVKVVSAEDAKSLDRVAKVYESIVPAGVFKAKSIKVAEAAKVIENTQRDLNVALMNEMAMIFARLGISSRDVLAAARTKWNFLPFVPGLVGGHCIGVDPYYLTYKAEELGYHPQVILAGRRINDSMGTYVAQAFVKLLAKASKDGSPRHSRVGVLGLTFKENVRDLRNSRVPDIVRELQKFGIEPLVHDPLADPEQAMSEYGIELMAWESLQALDGVLIVVPHAYYREMSGDQLLMSVRPGGAVFDVKSILDPGSLPAELVYGSL
jgi:UDP-N-acetyl-D-glucosamine/UDP-N-acetyl-D-galactosamine dehydrogenase